MTQTFQNLSNQITGQAPETPVGSEETTTTTTTTVTTTEEVVEEVVVPEIVNTTVTHGQVIFKNIFKFEKIISFFKKTMSLVQNKF